MKIEKPAIDFNVLLQYFIFYFRELSDNIENCIEHNVCHFCGVIFTFQSVNTICSKNNSTLDSNEFVGFCSKKPEALRWSTHRHFFGEPEDKYRFFRTPELNSFSINLRTLLLKLKTICIVKNINLPK